MLGPKTLDEFARRMADALPAGWREMGDDLERAMRASIEGTLARLNLVTRAEFEAQRAVLARTRERLEMLEARVRALESAGSAELD